MPIFMDVHIVPGVKARDVAEAHRLDLLHQGEYNCKCMTYWIDEERENIFCLIEAPDKAAVEEMHNRAHGLVPNKIIEVDSTIVESFLGRIYDPSDAVTTGDGLKIFHDPSFRILLVTQMMDPVLLNYQLGEEKTNELLSNHNAVIRKNITAHSGREVEQEGAGFIISFSSAAKAVGCALAIQSEISKADADKLAFKMGINAGEPVDKSSDLFGGVIDFATHIGSIAKNGQISMASCVKELVSKDHLQTGTKNFVTLSPQDEFLLKSLYDKLEAQWQNPDFDITDYCQAMTMSQSQLYRKTISLTGVSPNILLKDFRLKKAKDLLKKHRYSIAQVTFDSGFTSPSYFTKCFKSKYGLLPNAYLELLNSKS